MEGSVRRRFEDGAVIFEQGAPAENVYTVREGRVRVSRTSEDGLETVLATLHSGELFGEMALFEHTSRSATVRAVGPAEIEFLTAPRFERLVGDPIVWRVLQKMSARIREVDDALEKTCIDDSRRRDAIASVSIRRSQFI